MPYTFIPCSTVRHALTTLLWCSVVSDPANHDGDYINCDELEPSPQLIAYLTQEWEAFESLLEALNFDPESAYAAVLHSDNDGDYWNQVAHDWILTRGEHGCGFWDGDWHEPWASKLTDLAQAKSPFELYLGEDDLLYVDVGYMHALQSGC